MFIKLLSAHSPQINKEMKMKVNRGKMKVGNPRKVMTIALMKVKVKKKKEKNS